MVRTIIFIVIACVGITALLSYCAPTKQGTLTLNPGPSFPQNRTAELGRTVARILPFCPGMSMIGKELLFTNLEIRPQDESTSLTFTVPNVPAIPAAWGNYDAPCLFTVAGDSLHIAGASCQAICLGKQPDTPVDELTVNLNPKAKNKQ
ncbi:MAG: hypothetical protein RRY29_00845 [Desulfovibrionaceae bacterium]